MSLLSEFVTAAHSIAKNVIGTVGLTIGGGTEIQVTLGEADFGRDYESGGFERSGSLAVVTSLAEFVAAYPADVETYEGKSAVINGKTWRVDRISAGASFVRVTLTTANKSA